MLTDRSRVPADHPGAGRFTGNGEPIPSRTASVRARLKDVLAEETEDEDGRTLTWAERVARGLVARAATGNVPATQLLIDQTDGPLARADQGDWQVTINYVHQQLNVHQDKALTPPEG